MAARKWVECQVCKLPTTNVNHLCICCWSVEAHIADYLKSEEGRKRIKEQLARAETTGLLHLLLAHIDENE